MHGEYVLEVVLKSKGFLELSAYLACIYFERFTLFPP